jgi:hypothetical protein
VQQAAAAAAAAAARPVRPVQTGRDDNHKVSPFFKNLNGGQVIGRETRFGVAEFSLLGAPIFPPHPLLRLLLFLQGNPQNKLFSAFFTTLFFRRQSCCHRHLLSAHWREERG